MMHLSKPLQEDIKNNQFSLKIAIKNHQSLVLKLGSNYEDPAEIKQKLADIQKHIISLGEAQKILVARVKKEVAVKSWNNNNNNNTIADDTHGVSERSSLNVLRPSSTTQSGKWKDDIKPTENDIKGKRKRDNANLELENKNEFGNEDIDNELLSPSKKPKSILSDRRPSTPASSQDFQQNEAVGSSSEDSRESAAAPPETAAPVAEISKEQFLSLLNLITKDTLVQMQSKHRERRRRRFAGHHSMYTSHWDLTVQRRNRTKLDRESERQIEFEREESPIGSPPIIEVKKDNDSSSDIGSPSPPPLNKSRDDSSFRNICIICRKTGILSICDNCSATYHWNCLDKVKNCPQCQIGQISPESLSNSRASSPNPNDDALSKVLGDTSKPPTRVSSKEIIERYNRNNAYPSDDTTYLERLKFKKKLEMRKASLKLDLDSLEEKAAKLSECIVNQNNHIKELSSDEDTIKERIKKVVDFIAFMKQNDNIPS